MMSGEGHSANLKYIQNNCDWVNHQVTAGVHAPAGHRVARPDLGRGRLAGEHRGVDGRTARDHDSVRRDRLAGADGELIADG